MPRHRITNPDEEARTGTCSVCGPVTINSGSTYGATRYWRCSTQQSQRNTSIYEQVKDKQREARFLRTYGITVEEYDRRFIEQGGVCARCRCQPQMTLRLAVDHSHETGEVRGLLCGPCNTYLGRLEANVERLTEDLGYLGLADKIKARLVDAPVTGW